MNGEHAKVEDEKYVEYPLLQDFLRYEKIRNRSFHCDGYNQYDYPQGSGGWLETLCIIRGRAIHNIWIPWLVVTLHSVLVTVLVEIGPIDSTKMEETIGDWSAFYGLVLNVVLSFLLVFRLNRAGARYWEARQHWGMMIALGRTLTSGILCHGSHYTEKRDEALRWLATIAVSTMALLRGDSKLPKHTVGGILSVRDLATLEDHPHMPLYASDRVRSALQELFDVTNDSTLSIALAHSYTITRNRLEGDLDRFMNQYGAMERIRSTPLPIVYVSHLRSFLLLHLLLFPYVFVSEHRWTTIPVTMITAFAFLGIEGASMEVENPFKKGRVNNLNMDSLANALLQNMQQQLKTRADMELEWLRKKHSTSSTNTQHHHQQEHNIVLPVGAPGKVLSV